MSIEYVIRTLALADAMISTALATRWYPAPLPEPIPQSSATIYPAVTYQQVSQVNVSSHQGNSNLATTRLQLSLWATLDDDGTSLRDEIKRVLRDYKGTVEGDRIDRIEWANDVAMYDPTTQIHQRAIDLMVYHYSQY